MITVQISGLASLLRNFIQGPATVQRRAGEALDKSVEILHHRLSYYSQDYPRQRESAYVRTGTLQRSIMKEVDYQRFKGRVFTSLDYGPAVIGYGTQWAMHQQMGWWTNESVAREKLPEVVQAFEDANLKVAQALVRI